MTTMFSPSEVFWVKAISVGLAPMSCAKRRLRSFCCSSPKSARPSPPPFSLKAMWSASAFEQGTLIGWIAAELRYVCADAIGKSARTDGGKSDPSAAGALDNAGRADAASAAALNRNWRRSTDMTLLLKEESWYCEI